MPRDPHIYRQYAYLKISGYGPSSIITQRLGIEPDKEWSEGDTWQSKPPNEKRFFTLWQLNSGLSEDKDLNDHIRAILHRIRRKRTELQSLLGDYNVEMGCVSFNQQSFGFALDFDLQRELTSFGIKLWFDAYISGDVHELVCDLKDQIKLDIHNK